MSSHSKAHQVKLYKQLKQLATLFAFSCIAYIAPSFAHSPDANLREIRIKGFDEAYQAAPFILNAQAQIYIETPTIEFNKYWRKTHRTELTTREETKISERYQNLFLKTLKARLSKGEALNITNNKTQASYILRPQISNFFINIPDFVSNTANKRNYAKNIGHATLSLQLEDANSGQVILKLKDTSQIDSNSIGMERINRAVNARYFKNQMKRWASHLQTHLSAAE